MKSRQLLPDISSILKKLPNLHELEALLDLYPQASFLIDQKSNKIVLANRKASELTAYTRPELEELPLEEIIQNWHLPGFVDDLLSIKGEEISIIQRSGIQTSVSVSAVSLGANSPWILLTLEKKESIAQIELQEELNHQRWQALHLLSLAAQKPSPKEAINQMLQAGQLLSGASTLCIYQKSDIGNKLSLTFAWGNHHFLPTELPDGEEINLKSPTIWEPGNPTTSMIHKEALAVNAKYIASIPIETDEGYLILMDQISSPPSDLQQLFEIIAGTISTYQNQQALINQFTGNQEIFEFRPDFNLAITDSISDGIIFTNDELVITDINKTIQLSLGYSKNEAINQKLSHLLVGAEKIIPLLQSMTAKNKNNLDFGEFLLHNRNGDQIPVQISAIRLTNQAGKENYAILLSDNSLDQEYRNKEKQLEQQALLGEVTAIFAHEVRNPINNISTGLQVMTMNYPEDDPIQEQIQRLSQDCDRLTDLMQSVLSFAGPKEYKLQSISPKDIIENLLVKFQPQMAENNVTKQINSSGNIPKIKGDRRALEQVFTNIISNAIQAMKTKGGVLGVRFELPSDEKNILKISISDSGMGISEENKNKIFDPFFTTHTQGTGLGLSITKRIIAAHNGHISVDSWPEGTVFYLRFPIAEKN